MVCLPRCNLDAHAQRLGVVSCCEGHRQLSGFPFDDAKHCSLNAYRRIDAQGSRLITGHIAAALQPRRSLANPNANDVLPGTAKMRCTGNLRHGSWQPHCISAVGHLHASTQFAPRCRRHAHTYSRVLLFFTSCCRSNNASLRLDDLFVLPVQRLESSLANDSAPAATRTTCLSVR